MCSADSTMVFIQFIDRIAKIFDITTNKLLIYIPHSAQSYRGERILTFMSKGTECDGKMILS